MDALGSEPYMAHDLSGALGGQGTAHQRAVTVVVVVRMKWYGDARLDYGLYPGCHALAALELDGVHAGFLYQAHRVFHGQGVARLVAPKRHVALCTLAR